MKAKLVLFLYIHIFLFSQEVESSFDPSLLCKYNEVKTARGYESGTNGLEGKACIII